MDDVLIVGAGPAGSSLARQLALAGFAVSLCDQKEFPRHKPCGEFLSPECVPYLDALGLHDALTTLGAHRVAGMRLAGHGACVVGSFRQLPGRGPHGRTGFGVRRERFDHHLVQAAVAAGVRFLPRHGFERLLRDADGRVVGATVRDADGGERDLHARWTVGADGVRSRLARDLGVQRRSRWLDQFALVAHFADVPPAPKADVHLLRGGFFAATTVDDGVYSLNLVLPKHQFRQRDGADWDAFVAHHASAAPNLRARLATARRTTPWRGCGPFAHHTTQPWAPGAALVGDAAGYVDPLTGEGIYFALFGARALGEALAAALHQPATSEAALRGYAAARRRELAPRFLASALLQRALRWPWLVRRFLHTLGRWPKLADLVVTLSGDTIHPRELWRPTFWRQWGAAV
jgi:flavin-dependent dehydrogenase